MVQAQCTINKYHVANNLIKLVLPFSVKWFKIIEPREIPNKFRRSTFLLYTNCSFTRTTILTCFMVQSLITFTNFCPNNNWWVWSCPALGLTVDLVCSMIYFYFLENFAAKKAHIVIYLIFWYHIKRFVCSYPFMAIQVTIGPTAALTVMNGCKSHWRWI